MEFIRSHELRLRLKHVIHSNPSSLAELETPHAQASWAQGSCCAGQARREGAASSARLRQRPCEGQWGRALSNILPGYQSAGGHIAALGLALCPSQDLLSRHPFHRGPARGQPPSHVLSHQRTGEACHCACPRRGLLWALWC